MRNSLDNLLERFPYFLSRDGDSNFVKSESVFNNWFQELYNDMFIAYCNHHLSKPVLIWKTQEADYEYTIHFTVVLENLKSVVVYKNGVEVYREDYSYEDNVGSFYYTYDDTCTEDLIPSDSYLCSVETYEEYSLVKGFPENDPTEYISTSTSVCDDLSTDLNIRTSVPNLKHVTVKKDSETLIDSYDNIDETLNLGTPTLYETVHILVKTEDKMEYYEKRWSKHNSYDHDSSLDEIGVGYSMPRKTYSYNHREWQDTFYPNTEPPWNNRYTEDDYHYMNRMITYASLYHTTPLPILELWKLFGVEATMENRNDLLCKMYEESLHDPNWKPVDDYTHKNLQEAGVDDEDSIRLLFVSVDNSSPFEGVSVYFSLSLYDRYFDLVDMVGGVLEVYSRTGDGSSVLVDTVTTGDLSSWVLDTGDLDGATAYSFKYYNSLDDYNNHNVSAESDEVFITVKGCDDADIYVSTVGDDSNTGTIDAPVKTVEKALSMVEDDKNIIFLSKGDYPLKGTLPIIRDCTLAHCYNGDANLVSPRNSVFNISPNSVLNLIRVDSWFGDSVYRASSDVHRNTSRTGLPHEVIINGDNTRIPLVVSLDTLTGYPSEDLILTGSLMTRDGVIVTGKEISVEVGGIDYKTITDKDGRFSLNLGKQSIGVLDVMVDVYTDTVYRGVSEAFSVVISKEPTVLGVVSDYQSYKVGHTATVTCTLLDSSNEAISGVSVSDGVSTVVTGDDGTAVFTYSITEAGTTTHTYTYTGSEVYESSTGTVSYVTTEKTPTKITLVWDKTTYYPTDKATLTVGLVDDNENGLGGATLNLGTETITLDNNGYSTLTYSSDKSYTEELNFSYDGDGDYVACTNSTTFTVDKYPCNLSLSRPEVFYEDEPVTFKVTVTNTVTNELVEGVTVKEIYHAGTSVTGADGVADITYIADDSSWGRDPSLTVQKIITYYFILAENDVYTSNVVKGMAQATDNRGLTFSLDTSSTLFVEEDFEYYITVKDSSENLIPDIPVCDGETTVLTGSDGVATFTYSSPVITVLERTYTYGNYSTVLGSRVNGLDGDINVSYDKSEYLGGETVNVTGSVSISDSHVGHVLHAEGIKILISSDYTKAGGTWSEFATIDADGGFTGSFVADTTLGGHRVGFMMDTNDYYEFSRRAYGYDTVEAPKMGTVLSASSDKSSYGVGESATVSVTLKDSDGNLINSVAISDGVTSLSTVDGVTVFTYSCDSVGVVEKSYSFGGDSTYESSTVSVSYSVVDSSVTPELSLSADSLVGESGDTLSLSVASNLSSGTVSLVDAYDTSTVYGSVSVGGDGTAVLEYSCTGVGDLSVCAMYEDTQSNTLLIEDCLLNGLCV